LELVTSWCLFLRIEYPSVLPKAAFGWDLVILPLLQWGSSTTWAIHLTCLSHCRANWVRIPSGLCFCGAWESIWLEVCTQPQLAWDLG